jgi:3-carboxy-cis,cis-muconate cycloisomerase
MPQKRNPVSSSYILGCTGVVRQHVAALLDAMVAEHERSNGPWEIEWIVIPEIFLLASGALAHTRSLVSGLQVDPVRMRKNLELTGGMIVAEAVMMGLGPHLGRQRAHDLVYEICRAATASGRPLLDLLADNPEIAQHVDRATLAKLTDPANYLGVSGEMIDSVLATYKSLPKVAKAHE